MPKLESMEPLVRVRLLLAALYLSPEEADGIRAEIQVLICPRETHTLYHTRYVPYTLYHAAFT